MKLTQRSILAKSYQKLFLSTLILLILFFKFQLTVQLKLTAVHIPSLVKMGTNFWLSCQFKLEQYRHPSRTVKSDQLYSVKWYKNNEEFYRLMLNPSDFSSPSPNKQPVREETDYTNNNMNNQHQQQQYFAQNGVNVMMSSSNATHVRLLNASVETEGIYACEISTQNLSTIRYEKNIRVYVLPNSKLNIIGFKNRYSLGDKVDLICSSDFSRPQPALAWFVNGQRISNSNQWFELNSTNKRNKLNEPNLFGLNLSLKFKLTQEFLAAFLAATSEPQQAVNSSPANNFILPSSNQRNQSHTRTTTNINNNNNNKSLQHQYQLSPTASNNYFGYPYQFNQQHRGQFALKVQCKYKLAEVSDVTFNELVITQTSDSASSSSLVRSSQGPRKPLNSSSNNNADGDGAAAGRRKHARQNRASRQKRKVMTTVGRSKRRNNQEREEEDKNSYKLKRRGVPDVRIAKSRTSNQVLQTKYPANYKSLVNFLFFNKQTEAAADDDDDGDQCKLGSLALYPDNPVVLIESVGSTVSNNNNDNDNAGEEGEEELPITSKEQQDNSEDNLDKEDNYHELDETNNNNNNNNRRKRESADVDQFEEDNFGDDISSDDGAQKHSIGDNISVNCSTISALYNQAQIIAQQHERRLQIQKHHHREQQPNKLAFCGDPQRKGAPLWGGSSVNRAGQGEGDGETISSMGINTNEQQQQSSLGSNQRFFSSSPSSPWLSAASSNQQQQQQLSSTGSYLTTNNDNNNNKGRQRSFSASFAYLSLDGPILLANNDNNNNNNDGTTTSAQDGHSQPITTTADSSSASGSDTAHATLLAPPLLEWFINNQEAPSSSISGYSPELPLLAAPSSGMGQYNNDSGASATARRGPQISDQNQNQRKQQAAFVSGWLAAPLSPEVLPSVDSTEYFANFNSRPISQSLALNIKLNKKHFMSPDLKLRLRCSSTQAKVLMVDSAMVTILPVLNNTLQQHNLAGGGGWQQRPTKNNNKLKGGYYQTSKLSPAANVKSARPANSSSSSFYFS